MAPNDPPMRIGYPCQNMTLGTSNRTCRLANATPTRIEELARENLASIRRMAAWNADHGMHLLRVASDIIPFGGLPTSNGWQHPLAADLTETARVLHQTNVRPSTHPGPFTILNSPRPEVNARAITDLHHHADLLDALGHPDAPIVIHLGGGYGDTDAALHRFIHTASQLPEPIRRHLVLENDDRIHNAANALRAAEATGLPLVFDIFHDTILPSPGISADDAFLRALDTWPPGRTPKVHYSDGAIGKRPGAHADLVDPGAFATWLTHARTLARRDFDVMIEAKMKDQAVLPLVAMERLL